MRRRLATAANAERTLLAADLGDRFGDPLVRLEVFFTLPFGGPSWMQRLGVRAQIVHHSQDLRQAQTTLPAPPIGVVGQRDTLPVAGDIGSYVVAAQHGAKDSIR